MDAVLLSKNPVNIRATAKLSILSIIFLYKVLYSYRLYKYTPNTERDVIKKHAEPQSQPMPKKVLNGDILLNWATALMFTGFLLSTFFGAE